MALGRIVVHEPVATVDLHVFVQHEFEDLTADHLRNRRLDGELLERRQRRRSVVQVVGCGVYARIDHAGRPIEQCLERVHADRHFAEFVFDRAKRRDRLAELLPLCGVTSGFTNGALGAAAAHGAELEAPEVEHVEGDFVPFSDFTEQVFRRHANVLEDHGGRR